MYLLISLFIKARYATRADNPSSPRAIDHQTKTLASGMKNFLSSCWEGLCKRLPRQLATVLGCLPEVKGKDTMHFQHRTQKIQPGSDLKASSWELDLIALGGALPVAKEGKQSILLPSCDVYEPQEWPAQQATPETATVTLISWQAVTHSPLIGLKLFYRREVTPGSGNLVNCPQLVMQWILEENLLPPLYQSSRIPNCVLNIYPYIYRKE